MFENISKQVASNCLARFRQYLEPQLREAVSVYVNLGDLKTVRITACDPNALRLIRRELSWIMTDPVPDPDATIVLWSENAPESFYRRAFGLHLDPSMEEEILVLFADSLPFAQIDFRDNAVHVADGTTYFYGTSNYDPEVWMQEGHLFFQMFYRILNGPDSSLVHGACVGVDGKGVLMCARGGRGKSTLTVTSMLRGFEYVADDYLILERKDGELTASPIYSTIALSPKMYNTLYDYMDKARFVGVSNIKMKFVFDMVNYGDRLRRHYPVRACVFPEIDFDAAEPRIELCTGAEKGRAITHMTHSTVSQMFKYGLKQDQKDSVDMVKLIGMLRCVDHYKMVLCPDIFRNEEFLRAFVKQL